MIVTTANSAIEPPNRRFATSAEKNISSRRASTGDDPRDQRSARRQAAAAEQPAAARQARRPWLGRARQADRHDLDACGRGGEAAVPGQARRPCRHARSARLRRPADRARRSHQDRSLRDGRPQALSLHGAPGARSAIPTTPRAGSSRPANSGPPPRRSGTLLPQFTGLIEQIPPQYSAIKVQGERAYDLARDGETVELKPRPVEIHQLTLVEQPDSSHSVFEAECGKGTYVRALARDIGRILGCYGHICALRRTLVGPFGESGHDSAGTVGGFVR